MIHQLVHQLIHILWRILHSIRPVFQVEVYAQSLLLGISHLVQNVSDMFLWSLVQLMRAMFQRTLCQQVDDLTTTLAYPVDRLSTIHKAQHLDTVQTIYRSCKATNGCHRFLLAFRHTSRSHLDTVYVQVLQQLASHHLFLVRQKAHTIGLLSVAQCRVHDLHKGRYPFIVVYLLRCSHASVFDWFSTKKSISSSPFIRQCFLYPLISNRSCLPVALLVTVWLGKSTSTSIFGFS